MCECCVEVAARGRLALLEELLQFPEVNEIYIDLSYI